MKTLLSTAYLIIVILLFSSFNAQANSINKNEIISNPLIIVTITITSDYNGFPVSCIQATDASVIVDASGGTSPYVFEWSNGAISQELTGIGIGNYTVTVTDDLGQSEIASVTIFAPPVIATDIVLLLPDTLIAITIGGISPYAYLWSNGETTQSIVVVDAGTYTVEVTDINECLAVESFEYYGSGPDWEYLATGDNHIIMIHDTIDIMVNGNPVEIGDYIGVFYDSIGVLKNAGYVMWTGSSTAIAAFGDDPTTSSVIDGFSSGEQFIWKIWDASRQELLDADVEYNYTGFVNGGYYETNGISGLLSIHGYSEQQIDLSTGWSIISTFIQPFNPELEEVFYSLQQNIIIIKNEMGLLYYPFWDLNLIGSIVNGEGYEIKMNNNGGLKSNFLLVVNGVKVDPDEGIELEEGWSIFAYYHRDIFPVTTMLASIDSAIAIVKDKDGNVYIPNPPSGPPINTIQNMYPGDGYKIKILAGNNVILYYPEGGGTKQTPVNELIVEPEHFVSITNTGNNHTIIIPQNAWENEINCGDEVAVFYGDLLVGCAAFNNDVMVIPVFGNDNTTDYKEGPVEDDVLSFVLWHNNKEISFEIKEWYKGDNKYGIDKISIADEIDVNLQNKDYSISVFPNPNKGTFRLNLNLPTEQPYIIEITDSEGSLLFKRESNNSKQYLSFEKFAPGVYFARVYIGNEVLIKKIIIQ